MVPRQPLVVGAAQGIGVVTGARTTVLVTGAGGQLGHELQRTFSEPHVDLIACDRRALDVADRDQVLGALGEVRPDIVVNAATFTNVDACETEVDRAFAVNAYGVRHLAEGCRRFGAHLVQISTDYVFDGTAERPYTEWDEPNPLSVYGRSKLAGEHEAGETATIVRTSWLQGAHGSNFVKTMLRLAAEPDRSQISVVDDQHGSPTFTADLGPVIRRMAIDRRPGVHHVTNAGDTTWFELARAALGAAGHDPERIVPTSTADYGAPAPRPARSVLDNVVMRLAGWDPLPPWQDGLARLVPALTAAGGAPEGLSR